MQATPACNQASARWIDRSVEDISLSLFSLKSNHPPWWSPPFHCFKHPPWRMNSTIVTSILRLVFPLLLVQVLLLRDAWALIVVWALFIRSKTSHRLILFIQSKINHEGGRGQQENLLWNQRSQRANSNSIDPPVQQDDNWTATADVLGAQEGNPVNSTMTAMLQQFRMLAGTQLCAAVRASESPCLPLHSAYSTNLPMLNPLL